MLDRVVGPLSLCVVRMIASEFMLVSVLTPIAHDLYAMEGLTCQAISLDATLGARMLGQMIVPVCRLCHVCDGCLSSPLFTARVIHLTL